MAISDDYRPQPNFLVFGAVFQMRLTDGDLDPRNTRIRRAMPQKPIYRRLVVVKEGSYGVQCLYMKTYQNQATTRSDVIPKQHEHAPVYTKWHHRVRLPGEDYLLEPIWVDLFPGLEDFSCFMRINYGKTHEVSYNEAIFPLGEVAEASREVLRRDFVAVNSPRLVQPNPPRLPASRSRFPNPAPPMFNAPPQTSIRIFSPTRVNNRQTNFFMPPNDREYSRTDRPRDWLPPSSASSDRRYSLTPTDNNSQGSMTYDPDNLPLAVRRGSMSSNGFDDDTLRLDYPDHPLLGYSNHPLLGWPWPWKNAP